MSVSSIPVSHSPTLNLIHLYLIYSCIKFRKILLVLNTVESLKMDRNVHRVFKENTEDNRHVHR